MTCRELADFLADYLAGELPSVTRSEFERHLDLCANCRTYLTSYKETVRLGKKAFEDDDVTVPADVPDELLNAILAARTRKH